VGVDETGLSLVEVMVAAGLLSMALMPLAYMQGSGFRRGKASFNLLTASALAVELSDKARALPYTDPRLGATSGFAPPSSTLSNANPLAADGTTWTSCAPAKCGFTRTWKISDNKPISNAKQIDVQVNWFEYGVARSFLMSTIKAIGS
jgi:Tfp pilus assembly protein PilV